MHTGTFMNAGSKPASEVEAPIVTARTFPTQAGSDDQPFLSEAAEAAHGEVVKFGLSRKATRRILQAYWLSQDVRGVKDAPASVSKPFVFSAYSLPFGTTFILGKRTWKLVSREPGDLMTFKEVSPGANTPDRLMNPSEVDDLYRLGVTFVVLMQRQN